jgi:hypothetical protein
MHHETRGDSLIGNYVQHFNATRASTAEGLAAQQRVLLRIGAICAIAGPLILFASFAAHGDLPAHVSTEAALRYIADHPIWLPIHLGNIVAALLAIGAFTALAGTLTPGAAGALGRLLVPMAIVGGMFVIFDYSVDGYDLWVLAEEWAAASGEERASLVQMTDTVITLLNGTFRSEILIFYGLTFLLAGLAVALDGGYPAWFGGIAAIAGGAVLLAGLLSFVDVSVPRQDILVFLVIVPLESLWLLILGVLMWRRASWMLDVRC